MNIIPANEVIGAKVKYKDYLGKDRFGKIGWIENYIVDQNEKDGIIVWVYIIDDDPEYNIHEMAVNFGIMNADGKNDIRSFMYAELRLSNEIELIGGSK